MNLDALSSDSSEEEIRDSGRFIPVAYSLEEEAIFIDIFTGRGYLKGQDVLISATPRLGNKVICRCPGFTFSYNNMSLLSFLLFLRDSHFNCSRMLVILPVSYT